MISRLGQSSRASLLLFSTMLCVINFHRATAWLPSDKNGKSNILSKTIDLRHPDSSLAYGPKKYRKYSTLHSTASAPSRLSSSNFSGENGRKKKRRMSNTSKHSSIKKRFRRAKNLERHGQWNDALAMYKKILEDAPLDAHSHLALARLEARREGKYRPKKNTSQVDQNFDSPDMLELSKARTAFANGTSACPESVHLWQAWAVYEESQGNYERARGLFEEALSRDRYNAHVCHAYGLMERKLGNATKAISLFSSALSETSTAALVCSMGEILIASRKFENARQLYAENMPRLRKEKDTIELCLASAWLEERYLKNYSRAEELLNHALSLSPGSSLVNVALARLEGRLQQQVHGGDRSGIKATAKKLEEACSKIERGIQSPTDRTDGRTFNALASLEAKLGKLEKARDILARGTELYPLDHALFQAAGKVEERIGNFTGARDLYSKSLTLRPSAPTLVASALLELRKPEGEAVNYTMVKDFFEEALILDPRHGPAYNAYGNAEFKRGRLDSARRIFKRGVQAQCSDKASLYHGYGKFELTLGNVDAARAILERGLKETRLKDFGSDSTHRDRAKFLSHTLGMLELNSNRPAAALGIFHEGISRSGNSSQLLLGAALSEMKLGKEEAARILFERSVLSDKNHAQAWQAWAVMETRAGNFKTALKLFQCGLQSAPTHGSLWHGYASLEMKKGNTQHARVLFAGGLKKAPNHIPLYQNWALLELREGNYGPARKLISEALTRNKKNGSGWLIAAQIEEETGNEGLVSLLLRRGIECAPNDAELYRKLGEYLVSQGRIQDVSVGYTFVSRIVCVSSLEYLYVKAREVFEKGIEVNPLYPLLYHSLAELEAIVFNLKGLSELNQRAASLFNTNALEPSASSSQAFGSRIKAKRSRSLPEGITALAEKIVEEDGDMLFLGIDGINATDPASALESVNGNWMESEYIGDLLKMDTISED